MTSVMATMPMVVPGTDGSAKKQMRLRRLQRRQKQTLLHQRTFQFMAVLPSLPDAARVWIHPAAHSLPQDTQSSVVERLEAFIEQWRSHETNVRGGATVLYNRFVIIAGARVDGADPSGCAIDDAAHAIDDAAQAFGIEWVPSLHVLYRTDDGQISSVSRGTFQERVEAGSVTTETTVFDPSVTTLGAIRHGEFEQAAGQSWHADAFSLREPA